MITELILMAAVSSGGGARSYSSPSRSYSSPSRSTTSSGKSISYKGGTTTPRGYAVPNRSTNYQGKSYSYDNSYSSFNSSNFLLWSLVINANTQNLNKDEVRDVYEDQLSNIKDGLKHHKKMPTYEQSYEQLTKAFRGHSISNQEIGSTLLREYSKVGPRPKQELPK